MIFPVAWHIAALSKVWVVREEESGTEFWLSVCHRSQEKVEFVLISEVRRHLS